MRPQQVAAALLLCAACGGTGGQQRAGAKPLPGSYDPVDSAPGGGLEIQQSPERRSNGLAR